MKKILTFIPLGVGISAAIIYILNIIQFKIINNGTALLQILSSLKIYLFISIGGFGLYFFIKVLDLLINKNKVENLENTKISLNKSFHQMNMNHLKIIIMLKPYQMKIL